MEAESIYTKRGFRAAVSAVLSHVLTYERTTRELVAKAQAHAYGNNLTPRDALALTRGFRFKDSTQRLAVIDALTNCHGVEYFNSVNGVWEYANAGETYAETVILTPRKRFIVSSLGDVLEQKTHSQWAEKNERTWTP